MQDNLIQTKPETTALEQWTLDHLTRTKVEEIRMEMGWSKYKYSSQIRLNRSWKLAEVRKFCLLSGLPLENINDYIPNVLIVAE